MSKHYPIVGVTGRAGAGKDTFCRIASELLLGEGVRAQTIACAEPLKALCADVFAYALDTPRTAFFGTQAQKEEALAEAPEWSGRRILQHIGTEGFRAIHPHVWAQHMRGRAVSLLQEGLDVVFVSDVRFLEEAHMIQKLGGILVRIRRNVADDAPLTHVSEAECAKITEDYTIDNQNKELYLLQNLVKDFLWQSQLSSSPSTRKRQG